MIKKIEPGLSYFQSPSDASESLQPLLEFASQSLAERRIHNKVPVYLMATAGLRVLPSNRQDELLSVVRSRLHAWVLDQRDTIFEFVDDYVRIISGQEEALYSWVATNFVLGLLDSASTAANQPVSKASKNVVELAGSSVQVSFKVAESRFKKMSPEIRKDVLPLHLDFNACVVETHPKHNVLVYAKSFEKRGANAARKLYLEKLLMYSKDKNAKSHHNLVLFDPCLHAAQDEQWTILKESNEGNLVLLQGVSLKGKKTVRIVGNSNWEKCQEFVSSFFEDENQDLKSVLNVEANQLQNDRKDWIGLGDFLYSTNDIFNLDGELDRETFAELSMEYCKRNWKSIWGLHNSKLQDQKPTVSESRLRSQCFKAAYLLDVASPTQGREAIGITPYHVVSIAKFRSSWRFVKKCLSIRSIGLLVRP